MDRVVFNAVGKRYGKLWALRGVNARLVAGETVMVIGPNGSGKTTLIKCLLGLVRPTEGEVVVDGRKAGPDPAFRGPIGYMPQFAAFPSELTVDQLLRMMNDIRRARSGSTDDRLIASLEVDALLDKRVSSLSGGMRQKVSAVLALRYRPGVLVLDEPTAGLDPVSAHTLIDAVKDTRRQGGTVIITSHVMEEVQQLADRVAYLQDGLLRFLLPPETILDATNEHALSAALPKFITSLPPAHVESR